MWSYDDDDDDDDDDDVTLDYRNTLSQLSESDIVCAWSSIKLSSQNPKICTDRYTFLY